MDSVRLLTKLSSKTARSADPEAYRESTLRGARRDE
jgi:hypothetical protein